MDERTRIESLGDNNLLVVWISDETTRRLCSARRRLARRRRGIRLSLGEIRGYARIVAYRWYRREA